MQTCLASAAGVRAGCDLLRVLRVSIADVELLLCCAGLGCTSRAFSATSCVGRGTFWGFPDVSIDVSVVSV